MIMWALALFRLSILAIITLILCQKEAFAPPYSKDKIPLELELFEEPPRRVEVVESKDFPGGINYTIKGSSRHTHIIGDVIDNGQLLHGGDPRAVSKYVFVLTMANGIRYIRIFTKNRGNSISFARRIDEFIKVPGDNSYRPVVRTPIELNIMTQGNDHHINVEVFMPPDEEKEAMEKSSNGTLLLPTHYSIRPQYTFNATIGKVTYGRYIIEDRITGLMERTVVWGGRIGDPVITITSRYSNANEIKSTYALMDQERKIFHCYDERRRFINSRL